MVWRGKKVLAERGVARVTGERGGTPARFI